MGQDAAQGGDFDYPVRFFNLLVFDRPDDLRSIFKWCKIFYRSSGLFRDVVDKMSRYPVTSIEVTGENADQWSDILNNQLRVREKLVAIHINKYTYGNAFISIIPLFNRYLECSDKNCGAWKSNIIEKMSFKYINSKFHAKCNACGKPGIMRIKDEYIKGDGKKVEDGINIKIWPTESIYVKINNVTGKRKIIYKLDKNEINGIKKGDRFYLETMPTDFLDAVAKFGDKAAVELDNSKTFWYKEEDLEEPNATGMGLPFFFSAWKTLWQIFIYRKAQESIVSDHLLPYRVVYPESQANVDPISAMDLGQWRTSIQAMLHRWYNDPNEIGELPFPIGFQQLGGNGKAMSLTEDIRAVNQDFLIECGIPPELIYGGMTWTGSNVTLRMLENKFIYTTNQDNIFLKSLCTFIASHFGKNEPKTVALAPFRMADDIAKANMYLGLAAQGKISYQRALGVLGDAINFDEESKIIAKEKISNARALTALQAANAEAGAESSRITNREQVVTQMESASLQQEMAPILQSSLSDAVSITTPQGIVLKLNAMPEDQRQQELKGLQAMNPDMYQQIIQQMGMGSAQVQKPVNQPSTKPLPEQLPPRAEGANRRI